MRTIEVTATPRVVVTEIEQASIAGGPTVLERAGEPLAILLPMSDYQMFVGAPQTNVPPPAPPEFLREVEAFERLKPMLLSQEEYCGRAVAIHQGQVVAVGDDKMEVLAEAWEEFGEVPIYVEWVTPETPRRVRIPSIKVRR